MILEQADVFMVGIQLVVEDGGRIWEKGGEKERQSGISGRPVED